METAVCVRSFDKLPYFYSHYTNNEAYIEEIIFSYSADRGNRCIIVVDVSHFAFCATTDMIMDSAWLGYCGASSASVCLICVVKVLLVCLAGIICLYVVHTLPYPQCEAYPYGYCPREGRATDENSGFQRIEDLEFRCFLRIFRFIFTSSSLKEAIAHARHYCRLSLYRAESYYRSMSTVLRRSSPPVFMCISSTRFGRHVPNEVW